MHGFAALDFRPRQRYTADKAASDKAAAAFIIFCSISHLYRLYKKFGIDPFFNLRNLLYLILIAHTVHVIHIENQARCNKYAAPCLKPYYVLLYWAFM